MKALVTGATGFVGAAVARTLIAAGWQVRVLVRPGSDRGNLQTLAAEVAEGDLNDLGSLERALEDCEALFHVAADYRLGARDPKPLYLTNVEGTRNILSAARTVGVRRTVYTSSVATMGIPPDGTPGEESTSVGFETRRPLASWTFGSLSRRRWRADAARTGMSSVLVIVNPSAPVGPGDIKRADRANARAGCGVEASDARLCRYGTEYRARR